MMKVSLCGVLIGGFVNVEEWTSPSDGSPSTVDSVTITNDVRVEETTITDAAIAANSYIMLDLSTTDVNWVGMTIHFQVEED